MAGASKFASASAVIALAGAVLTGCVSIHAIEPVEEPPAVYQVDALAPVEFLHPAEVGFRCAERGAKFFGLPGINSMACADRMLITMPDPCVTLTAGAFAEALCTGAQRLRAPESLRDGARDAGSHGAPVIQVSLRQGAPAPRRSSVLAVEFVAPAGVAYRCAERGAKMNAGMGEDAQFCVDDLLLTVSNPCALSDGEWYARLLCHELAHANGWPHDHSKGTLIAASPIMPMRMGPLQQAFAARGIPSADAIIAKAAAGGVTAAQSDLKRDLGADFGAATVSDTVADAGAAPIATDLAGAGAAESVLRPRLGEGMDETPAHVGALSAGIPGFDIVMASIDTLPDAVLAEVIVVDLLDGDLWAANLSGTELVLQDLDVAADVAAETAGLAGPGVAQPGSLQPSPLEPSPLEPSLLQPSLPPQGLDEPVLRRASRHSGAHQTLRVAAAVPPPAPARQVAGWFGRGASTR